jgi:hypothetical protein
VLGAELQILVSRVPHREAVLIDRLLWNISLLLFV